MFLLSSKASIWSLISFKSAANSCCLAVISDFLVFNCVISLLAKTSSTETSFLSAQEAKRTVANKIKYIFFIGVFYLVKLIGKFNAFSKAALVEITSNIDCI